jgi:hypothetical protein
MCAEQLRSFRASAVIWVSFTCSVFILFVYWLCWQSESQQTHLDGRSIWLFHLRGSTVCGSMHKKSHCILPAFLNLKEDSDPMHYVICGWCNVFTWYQLIEVDKVREVRISMKKQNHIKFDLHYSL